MYQYLNNETTTAKIIRYLISSPILFFTQQINQF